MQQGISVVHVLHSCSLIYTETTTEASTSWNHALNDTPTGCDSRNYLNPVIYSNSRKRKRHAVSCSLQLKVLMLAVNRRWC